MAIALGETIALRTVLMAENLNNEDSVRTESRVSAATLTATLRPATEKHRSDWDNCINIEQGQFSS